MAIKKINVQIIQPVVPKYRVPLFESLFEDERFKVFIMASKEEPGGVKSISSFNKNIELSHNIKTILKKLMWQKKLYLLPQMTIGDVLIINGNIKFLSNYPLILEAKKRKVSVVWWGHGWSSTTSKLSFFIRKHIMKTVADILLLYTEREKKIFIKNGFDDKTIFYMNNTIYTKDIELFKKTIKRNDLDKFKIDHGLSNKKVLLFVGRLRENPPTDLSVAFDALKYLSLKNHNDFIFAIVGDGEEKSKLTKIVKKLDLEKQVIFLSAIYDEEVLAPWFLSADCFVYPGAIGLSLLHAFAYGVPVVTHNIITKHGPEIAALEDGINGLLYIKNNEIDLANKIEKVIENNSYYSSNAIETISNEFSYDNTILRVKKCIVSSSTTYATITKRNR